MFFWNRKLVQENRELANEVDRLEQQVITCDAILAKAKQELDRESGTLLKLSFRVTALTTQLHDLRSDALAVLSKYQPSPPEIKSNRKLQLELEQAQSVIQQVKAIIEHADLEAPTNE